MGDSALSWFKSYVTDRSRSFYYHWWQTVGPSTDKTRCTTGIGARSCTVPVICERYSIAPVSFLNRHFRWRYNIISEYTFWTDIPSMVQDMNSDLDDINEWSAQNRMIINTDKTKSILRWSVCAIHKRKCQYTNKSINSQANYPIHNTKYRFTKINFNTQQSFAKYTTKYFSVHNKIFPNTQQKCHKRSNAKWQNVIQCTTKNSLQYTKKSARYTTKLKCTRKH